MYLLRTQFRRHAARKAAGASAAAPAGDVWQVAGGGLTLGDLEKTTGGGKKAPPAKRRPPSAGGKKGDYAPRPQRAIKTGDHPTAPAKVNFNPNWHRYDYVGRRMRSVTGMMNLPLTDPSGETRPVRHPFQKDVIASKVAAMENMTPEEIIQQWDYMIMFGTKFHTFAEAAVKGVAQPVGVGRSWSAAEHEGAREKAYKEAFANYWTLLREDYRYNLTRDGCERIVFSPSRMVAGMLDCLLHCPTGNEIDPRPHYLLIDWKTNSKPLRDQDPLPGEPGTMNWPFDALPATSLSEYKVQLNTLRHLLVTEGYVEKDAVVRMAVVQFLLQPSGEVEVDGIDVEDLGADLMTSYFDAVGVPEPPKVAKSGKKLAIR